jgi:hypothetical protein
LFIFQLHKDKKRSSPGFLKKTVCKKLSAPHGSIMLNTSPARSTGWRSRIAAITCRHLKRDTASGRHQLFDFFMMTLRAFGIFVFRRKYQFFKRVTAFLAFKFIYGHKTISPLLKYAIILIPHHKMSSFSLTKKFVLFKSNKKWPQSALRKGAICIGFTTGT